MLASASYSVPCAASAEPALVEIEDRAGRLLDERTTRRLVALELADIDVPPASGNKRVHTPLFFRVVQVDHELRVELWERGEYYGSRTISSSNAAGQLGARRVALAAAELARRLQRKRRLQSERQRKSELARASRAASEARRAVEGPLALRSSVEAISVGTLSTQLFGPRLAAQASLARRVRLDVGMSWLFGRAPAAANLEWLELSLAPMRRFSIGERFDLDFGLALAAAWVRLARVRAVDEIPDQSESWSARSAVVLRAEPTLARHVRLSLGAEAGLMLRAIRFQALSSSAERLRGAWLGIGVGVVFTPD